MPQVLTIKVQCPCGTRFAFEVMPVNGKMPVQVNCPNCNADDTDLANSLIQQQLGGTTAQPSVPVAVPVATAASAPKPSAPLAIPTASPASAPAPAIPVATPVPPPVAPIAPKPVSAPAAIPALKIPSGPVPVATPAPAPVSSPAPAVAMPRIPTPPSASPAVAPVAISATAPSSVPVAVPVATPVATPVAAPVPTAVPVAAPVARPVPVAVPVAAVAPPSHGAGLKVSGLHHAQPAAPAAPVAVPGGDASGEPAVEFCPKHKTETAVEHCKVCGKPICLKCMEQFGYVCGVYCRQQATAKRIYIPPYANQKTVVAGKAQAKIKAIAAAVTVLVVGVLGLWFWYVWFARDYKIVYTIPLPKPNLDSPRAFSRPEEFYQLIGPGQLLTVKSKQVSLFDVNEQHNIWSAQLSTGPEKSAAPTDVDLSDDEDSGFYFGRPQVVATSNDVWVVMSDHLARFDRATGSAKDTGIKEKILNVSVRPDSIFVVAGERRKHEILANISLPDGSVQTEEINLATNAPAKAKPATPVVPATNVVVATRGKRGGFGARANQPPAAQLKNLAAQTPPPDTAAAADANVDSLDDFETFYRQPFTGTGVNAVEMKSKMIEHKTVSHQAMKAKGKSVLDSGNVNASQGIELAQEMMNDMRREETGGVEIEDVSRFEVTLHRHLAKDVPDWSGEVVGRPQFFALKTVDVLFAGQGLIVFDKQNKKLWDAKLTFPVVHHYSFEDASVPCIETKDSLYFADAGTLTRFDLATGNVKWRYNTVGITRIVADNHGGIYIVTSTAGPEQIQYSLQVNLHEKIKPVVMKLDAATGKVRWRNESIGDEIMLSGKFLYATRVSMTMALLRLEEGPDTHYNLNLLDTSNGSLIWNYHQGNRRVLKTEVQKNWILVQMEDEVVVMKFFSL